MCSDHPLMDQTQEFPSGQFARQRVLMVATFLSLLEFMRLHGHSMAPVVVRGTVYGAVLVKTKTEMRGTGNDHCGRAKTAERSTGGNLADLQRPSPGERPMKFGIRKPSIKRRVAARSSPRRHVRHSLSLKAPRGAGWLTSPKRAAYGRVYSRTSVSFWSLLSRLFR